MATLERTYTIPLRKEYNKIQRHKRAKKAVSGVFSFISRHMKQPDEKKILLGQNLNLHIWKHGIKNPPVRIKVNAVKDNDGLVKVELFGSPVSEVGKKPETLKDEKKKEVRQPIIVPPQKDIEAKAEVKEDEPITKPVSELSIEDKVVKTDVTPMKAETSIEKPKKSSEPKKAEASLEEPKKPSKTKKSSEEKQPPAKSSKQLSNE